METNDLKDFVDVNREAFEVYEYKADDWNAIADRLDQQKEIKKHVIVPLRYVWRAAAIIVIAFGTVFYMSWINWKTNSQQAIMNAELEEAAYYYNDLIAVKVAEISRLDRSAEQEVFQNLEVLDQAFMELKSDLEDNADNEEVVRAMINNYKIKLEILEQIIVQLEARKKL